MYRRVRDTTFKNKSNKSASKGFAYILVFADKPPQMDFNIPLELLVDSCIFSPSLMHQQGSGFLIGQTKWMSKLVQSKAVLLKPIKNLKAKAHTRYKREAAKLSFQI